MTAKRICIALTTRGNLAKMKSTIAAIDAHPDLQRQIVIGGALLDEDYGKVAGDEAFRADARLDYITADRTPAGIAQSAGQCTRVMGQLLAELQPDVLMVIADRYEALAIAQAALCCNVTIAHLEGGEVSGSIDERIRHAITKLAHIHFPANEEAAARLRKLGEIEETIHVVGTPSLDLLSDVDIDDMTGLRTRLDADGTGAAIDLDADYIVVSQHPVATEFAAMPQQIDSTLQAVEDLAMPTVWLLPNDEAGAPQIRRKLEALRTGAPPIRYMSSLHFTDYAVLMRHACCLLGNTSSGIREGAFLGVPVVNIGTRQNRRARGANVIDTGHDAAQIAGAARRQIARRRYPRDTLYGDGKAGEKIARVLAQPNPPLDKTIAY